MKEGTFSSFIVVSGCLNTEWVLENKQDAVRLQNLVLRKIFGVEHRL